MRREGVERGRADEASRGGRFKFAYRRRAGIYSTSAFTLWETPIVTALLTLRRRVPTRGRERDRERERERESRAANARRKEGSYGHEGCARARECGIREVSR